MLGWNQNGQQQTPQRQSWGDYLANIKNGSAPQYNGQQANGQSTGNSGSTLPATPINYDRIASLLSSGVLRPGASKIALPAQPDTPVTQQTSPAQPAQPSSPWDGILQRMWAAQGIDPAALAKGGMRVAGFSGGEGGGTS